MSLDLLTKRRPGASGADAQLAPSARSVQAAPRAIGVVGLVAVSAGVVLLNPVLVLCGLVATTTALLVRRLSWDLALPAGMVVVLAISTVAGVAGGLLGIDLLAWPWMLASMYVVYALAGVVWISRSPAVTSLTSSAPNGGPGWAAYVPAAIAAGIGLAQSLSERMAASWSFVGTDLAEHMILVQQIQRSGSLDYSASAYPRAFHMLAAFVSVPRAPLNHPAEMLSYDMRLVAAATWLSLALVLWAGATLALRLGAVLGVARLVTVGAAVLFGAGALLSNPFLGLFVYMGGAASLLGILVMLAMPLAALGLNTRRHRVLVLPVLTAISVMLLAHLWQTLLVVPLLAFAAYAAPGGFREVVAVATQRRRPAWLGKPLALVVAGSLVALAVGSVPMLRLQAAGGIGLASTSGGLTSVPWVVLVGGLALAVLLLRDLRRGSTRVYLGSILGLLLAAAVMLRGANHGFNLHQYYPMKVLWFLTVVLGPLVALATVGLGWQLLRPVWRLLGRLGGAARLCRFALGATLTAVAFALWLPVLVGNVSLTMASLARHSAVHTQSDSASIAGISSERFDIAVAYASRYQPAVTVPVAVGLTLGWNDYGPFVVSKLLSFQTGQPEYSVYSGDICADVAQITGGSETAVVITQIKPNDLRALMTKQGCGDVRVVGIPGRDN